MQRVQNSAITASSEHCLCDFLKLIWRFEMSVYIIIIFLIPSDKKYPKVEQKIKDIV